MQKIFWVIWDERKLVGSKIDFIKYCMIRIEERLDLKKKEILSNAWPQKIRFKLWSKFSYW